MNKHRRERYAIDESYRLACNLRSRLSQALRRQLANRSSKTEELLGISFQEFKEYIEFSMTPEISWKTYDLDHVRPLSSFDLTNLEQLKEASHFSNIQPLLKSDNRKKGSKYHEHDLAIQRDKVQKYYYFEYYNQI